MSQDFINFKQGTMTVSEYDIKFTSLSQFIEGMDPSDFDKARKVDLSMMHELNT